MVVAVRPVLRLRLLCGFPMKPGLLHVCAQSGQLVPLPVRNGVEVVAVHSRFICLNHQQTIVKSAFGKGISCRSALVYATQSCRLPSSAVSQSVAGLNVMQRSMVI